MWYRRFCVNFPVKTNTRLVCCYMRLPKLKIKINAFSVFCIISRYLETHFENQLPISCLYAFYVSQTNE